MVVLSLTLTILLSLTNVIDSCMSLYSDILLRKTQILIWSLDSSEGFYVFRFNHRGDI